MRRNDVRDLAPPAWIPHAIVFLASFCVMAVELVAGRLTSRQLGTSLYTWTSVIGVVLAGISAGNYWGGRLADRHPAAPTLATLLGIASAACVGIAVLQHRVGEWFFLWTLPWPVRVFAHVSLVFLGPSLALGTISPVAAKMALDRGRETGRTIGNVYAWGMVGSIVGTFATGFWLVAAFGAAEVVWTVALVLAAMSVFFGRRSWRPWIWTGALFGLAVLGTGPWTWARALGETLSLREAWGPDVLYVDESQYSHIRVYRASAPERRDLHLDQLLHSSILMDRPNALQYGYERIYAAVTHEMAAGRDSLNTLTIGGGGYVFPRYLDSTFPRSRTEVVEIDPAVTKAAVEAFALPSDHPFVVAHEDGRAHLRRTIERKRRGASLAPYDFIYLDVFDHYSVPFQLTTVEFLEQANELLAEDGAYLMNLIDVFSEGRFLGSMLETMSRVFPHVAVFAEGVGVRLQPNVRNTYILVGTKRPVDFGRVVTGYDPRIGLYRLTEPDLAAVRERAGHRLLTDDWSPIENLLAPVVKRASRVIAATSLVTSAEARLKEGEVEDAVRDAKRALALDPDSPDAPAILGNAYQALGDPDAAIEMYRRYLSTHPAHVGARINLAAALAATRRLDEAERELEEAVRLDPAHALAWRNLGVIRLKLGRVDQAVLDFETALRLAPDDITARQHLQLARRERQRRAAGTAD